MGKRCSKAFRTASQRRLAAIEHENARAKERPISIPIKAKRTEAPQLSAEEMARAAAAALKGL